MVEVYVSGSTIDIGRQGENEARNIYFDLSELMTLYGEGTATLVHMRPSDQAPYICETETVGNYAVWTPSTTDTAYAGSGKCELRWVVGETLAKSIIYTTTIAPSITGAEGVPDPYKSWYDAIISYIEANYAANGAPQEVREAIYTLLSKAAYIETGLEDELAIVQAWTAETISVTNNLTHVTNSNTATMAEQGGSYTGTLTADSGYVLGTVSVTMGGEDVTATVYSSGTITIPSVTGDIVITATAVAAVASLSAVYTQSGTVYDTDALDTLKADLVVTATYSDSTTATVPSSDYTLSGTLEVGTSTVTVSYGGATATFSVTVTDHRQVPTNYTWLYEASNGTLLKNDSYITQTNTGTLEEKIENDLLYIKTTGNTVNSMYKLSDATTTDAVLSCRAKLLTSGYDAETDMDGRCFQLLLSDGSAGAMANIWFLDDYIHITSYFGNSESDKEKITTNALKDEFHIFELKVHNGVQSLDIDGQNIFSTSDLSGIYTQMNRIMVQNKGTTASSVQFDWIAYKEY